MNNDRQKAYYERSFDRFGDSPQGLDWTNTETQHLRFERILEAIKPAGTDSILDVGCGTATMRSYMQAQGIGCPYTGVDISEKLVAVCRKKFPECAFHAGDIGSLPEENLFDLVVSSGIFNTRLDTDEPVWRQHISDTIRTMFRRCRKAACWNFLTSHSTFRQDTLHYTDPGEIIAFITKELTRFCSVDAAYPLYEFTVTAWRSEWIQSQHLHPALKKYFSAG